MLFTLITFYCYFDDFFIISLFHLGKISCPKPAYNFSPQIELQPVLLTKMSLNAF